MAAGVWGDIARIRTPLLTQPRRPPMLTRIRTWYASLPDPVKAAAATFAAAFVGVFGPAAWGWGTEFLSWAADLGSSAPDARPFPDPDLLTKALVAAAAAGAAAVVSLAFRAAQRRFSWIPGSGPSYPDAIEVREAATPPSP